MDLSKMFFRYWNDGRATVAIDPGSKDDADYRLAFSFCDRYDNPNKGYGKATAVGRMFLGETMTIPKSYVEEHKGIYNAIAVAARQVLNVDVKNARNARLTSTVTNSIGYNKAFHSFKQLHFPPWFFHQLIKDGRRLVG